MVAVKGENGDEERRVVTGASNGTLTQIVSGLAPGEEVLFPTTTATTAGGGATQQRPAGGFQAGPGIFIAPGGVAPGGP
jgi:hypothetical protein